MPSDQEGYLWYLDYEQDGDVDFADYYTGFRDRLGVSLAP